MSQQGLILVHTEKLKPKGPISKKLVSCDISNVLYYSEKTRLKKLMIKIIIIIIIIMNLSQETLVFGGRQKLTYAM